MAFLTKHDFEKSLLKHILSKTSINHVGRLIEMFSVLCGRLPIYLSSKKENAFLIWSGVAFFHCSVVLSGNNRFNLTAIGQDTFLLPVKVKLMVGWLNPRIFDICSCVIMGVIISYNLQCVNTFIAVYNYLLQGSDFIANYTVDFVIKGGVW